MRAWDVQRALSLLPACILFATALPACEPDAPATTEPDTATRTKVGIGPGAILRLSGGSFDESAVFEALASIASGQSDAVSGDLTIGLEKLLDDPALDGGKEGGQLRLAYIQTLQVMGNGDATGVLLRVLEGDREQPVALHKAAVEALGAVGPPTDAVIDALLTVQFRIPDAPGTQSIGERASRALAALGEPSLARTLVMLAGDHEGANALAEQNGIDAIIVKQLAVKILGAIALPGATESLVSVLPRADCKGSETNPGPVDIEALVFRAVVARSLGEIGDPRAVAPLCSCRDATHNAGDLWEIAMALGRIGGPEATACLQKIVETGEYNPEDLLSLEFQYEIRWESVRWMILAANSSDVPALRKTLAREKHAEVRENSAEWEVGLRVLSDCGVDADCFGAVLVDEEMHWFAREVAATQLSRLSPGDADTALAISEAFRVTDAGARVTMATMAGRTAPRQGCSRCADALQQVLDDERGTAKAEMQSAWLTARVVMARMRRGR